MLTVTQRRVTLTLVAVALFGLGSATHALIARHNTSSLPVPAAGQTAPVPDGLPDFVPLVQKNAAAVVNLTVTRDVPAGAGGLPAPLQRFFGLPPDSHFEQDGVGSGFVIAADGYILTNAHVVDGATSIKVKFSDRRERDARVIGIDKPSDIALIKVDAQNLPTVSIGQSGSLRVGQWVLAIGSPFGFDQSASEGIVSALGRSLPGDAYVPFVQTDVPINPGNSGGPLIDLAGRVVGINSQIYSQSGGYQGVSFSIPIDVAMHVVEQLKSEGHVTRGWLGVAIQPLDQDLATSFKLDRPAGALVASVMPRSPASTAGLRPGDVIQRFDGRKIENAGDLPPLVAEARPGNDAAVEIWRDGHRLELDIAVAKLPAREPGRD